ncbi:hypothetical protein AVEN_34584-1 [Araneus ventricosus]|uniref:Uncharacterized protein n=1 Tax=Araneus ventricosus TaxID=182803 RepID=A0A4Y2B051_ARAVE|nr:hypothetical protein AVEN_34584-1 [Araneus ventricosus]
MLGGVLYLAQWGRGGSGPARVGDEQRMTTGTRVFRHSVPLVFKFWVGRPEDVRSVPVAVLALGDSIVRSPHPFLPMSSLTKTGGVSHVHPTGLVAVMASGTGTWGGVLSYRGCGDLVVRPRLWGRKALGSKPYSTEDPPCIRPVAHKIILREPNVLPLICCKNTHTGPAYPRRV